MTLQDLYYNCDNIKTYSTVFHLETKAFTIKWKWDDIPYDLRSAEVSVFKIESFLDGIITEIRVLIVD